MSGIATVLANSLTYEAPSTILDEADASDIFSALANQQNGMEDLSNTFLQTGITEYSNGNYEKAAKAFEAAIAICPESDYNADTTKYLAQTYLDLEETDKAIATYEAAIERDRENDEFRTNLGQLYVMTDRYEEAATQYRAAVNINPSAENHYSYGEVLLNLEDYEGAEEEFKEVKRLEPDSAVGDYGLGKVYAQTEDYEAAIDHFMEALDIDPTFYEAYAEMGFVYADAGEIDAAKQIQETLEDIDEDLSETLDAYINTVEEPQIAFAYASSSTFPYKATANYPVSAIDSYLENAGAELSMTMTFQLTKEMDISSVLDRFNWSISKASSSNFAETYNFGNEIPSTEITLPEYPDYVTYDPDNFTATIGFTIRQNETADGTIDPSHIVFQFNGEDAYGVSMDEDADEYSGFSGVA